jgi:hypothetical protein
MVIAFAEGAVTQVRREFKLLLEPDGANELSERLCAFASPSTTAITSVYFDHPGFPLLARARATPNDCLKIRTKEYFPDPDGPAPRVALEAKHERNGLTQKQRVWISRASLAGLVRQGALWKQLPILEAGTLLPVVGVTYVRDVFQCSPSWRVTVDRGVSFHAVNGALAFGRRRLRADLLGLPAARERRAVIEVKHLGEDLPAWLAQLRHSAATRFSKFAEGMGRVQGDRSLADGRARCAERRRGE